MLNLTIKTEVSYDFEALKDNSWSGALDRLKAIEEMGVEDDFMDYLLAVFDDMEITENQLNDFIWFDCDEWIEEKNNEKA